MGYRLFDNESGEYSEVTKEAFEAHKKWMDKFKATIQTDKHIGNVIITSSTPDEEPNNFKEFWQE